MDTQPYILVRGRIVLKGKRPDGDSVRFKPTQPDALQQLAFSERLRVSQDGTVQLRLDCVDTPETHYTGHAQPLGIASRDVFLQMLGFDDIDFTASGTVTDSIPATIPATILAKMVEVNGRPVAYLFISDLDAEQAASLPSTLLRQSMNARLLQTGLAYPTLYTSTPSRHRQLFIDIASTAKAKEAGVWDRDATSRFRLVNNASIGPSGQLILPKLFRRCTDYLRAKTAQPDLPFLTWLTAATSQGMSENDELLLDDVRKQLSDLIQEDGNTIQFRADLLKIVFVEK